MRDITIIRGMNETRKALADAQEQHASRTDHDLRELGMSLKRVAMVLAAQQAVMHGGFWARLRWLCTGAFPKLQLEDVHRASAPWLTGPAGRFRPVETLPIPEKGTAVAQAEAVARSAV